MIHNNEQLAANNHKLEEQIIVYQQATAALRQSEATYRMLFDNINDIVYLVAIADNPLRGKWQLLNNHIENITGYKPEDFSENPQLWMEIIHPDDINIFEQTTQELARQKAAITRVYRLRHKITGKYCWIEDKVVPQIDTEGKLKGICGVARDITERKQAEEVREENEQRFRNCFAYAPIGMAVVSLDGHCLQVNTSLCEIVGYSEQELLHKTLLELTHPEDLDNDYNYIQQLLDNEIKFYYIEKRYLHKSGKIVSILLHNSLVKNAENEPIYFITQIKNITQRTAALNLANERLKIEVTERKRTEIAIRSLYKVAAATQLNFDQCMQGLLALGRRQFGLDMGALGHIKDNIYEVISAQIPVKSNFPLAKGDIWDLEQTYCSVTLGAKEPTAFESAGTTHWCTYPAYKYSRLESYIGIPVFVNSNIYGTLSFFSLKIREKPFTVGDKELLKLMARWIGSEIERQQAKLALQASESKYQMLAQLSPVGLFQLSPQGDCLYANNRWCELTGLTLEAAKGNGWLRCIHAEDYERVFSEWHLATQSQQQFYCEYRLQRPDGMITWVLGQAAAEYNSNGEIIDYVGTITNITKRKQAEIALQDAIQRLNFHADNSPLAVIEWDRDFHVLRWSKSAERIFGWQAEEVLGKHITAPDFIFYEDGDTNINMIKEMLGNTDKYHIFCNANYTKHDHILSCEWYNSKLLDDSGNIISVLSLVLDVTEREIAQEQLLRQNLKSKFLAEITLKIRQSLQLNNILEVTVTEVRSLLQVDRVLILQILPDGSGSKVVMESVDFNYIVLLDQTFSAEVFPPTIHEFYRQGHIQKIENIDYANLTPCHIEFLKQLEVCAKLVVPILQGENLWGLLIAHQCKISRQWENVEVELLEQLANQVGIALSQAQLLETIQESEKRFRQLAENINEVFWILDSDLKQVLYISPAYEKVWGYSCESLYKDSQSWLYNVHPHDQNFVIESLAKRGNDGEFFNQEYRIIRPDGSQRWIWAREFPIYNESGQVYRIAGLGEDITERKQIEYEIYKALQKEKELNELKSSFISMTSHEFRTPLSTILASSDLLKNFGNKLSEEKKLERLNKIQVEVRNLLNLLDDVLVIGKSEVGKIEFNPSILNLEKFCRELLEEIKIISQNHTFHFSCEGDLQTVYMDEKLLKHIFNNLLSNAVKYSPQGGNIYFEVIRQNNQAIFKIKDEGIGIPDTDQKRLFETFHRASNVSNIPGTGLGMAITKNSVELHGGSITFESTIDLGTTFIVHLPVNELPML